MLDNAMTITLSFRKGELVLTYERGDGTSPIEVNTGMQKVHLSKVWAKLRSDVRDFKKTLGHALKPGGAEIQGWGALNLALNQLYEAGQYLKGRLFTGRVKQIRDLFTAAFPCWDDPQCESRCISLRAPRVEDIVPIEFLPVFWEKPSRPISDIYSLERACRGFLGFSTVVRREFLVSKRAHDRCLQNPQRLPIKFFGNMHLRGAVREHSFFLKNQAHVELDGPWLRGDLGESTELFVRNTASYLWSHTCYCNGATRQPPDQIIHIACHCSTTSEDAQDHLFVLTCGGQKRHSITIRDLANRFTEIEETEDAPKSNHPRPLVFFNACGTSVIDPSAVTSFPSLFLGRLQNRGFIGSETELPDEVAEAFSRQFYAALLAKLPLGQAVQHAKRSMLIRYRNPMGLLYTVYADPDLEVSRKVRVLH
jgi:hypothetical protein